MKSLLKTIVVFVAIGALVLLAKEAYFMLRYPTDYKTASQAVNYLQEPVQENTSSTPIQLFDRAGREVTLHPVATYDIGARVVINRGYPRYDVSHPMKDLLTNDLVLAWGRVANKKYLSEIKFSHQFTYMTFRYNSRILVEDLGHEYISNHLSSNHLIGANKNIHNALRHLDKNDLVRITGHLVNIDYPGERLVTTSLSRTDNWRASEGNTGGSEFIYVTRLQKGNKVYE